MGSLKERDKNRAPIMPGKAMGMGTLVPLESLGGVEQTDCLDRITR